MQRRRDETVVDAVDAWLAAKEREPGARAGSLASYRARADHLRAFFGTMPVRAVRPEHLTRFAAELLAEGYAPATVQGIYAALTSSLRHAQRRGVIAALPLPLDGPGIPTPRPRGQRLTLAQVEQVIADMPGVWGQVAELILLTGLRWGEAVALEEADIEGDVLHVRRTRTRAGAVNAPKTAAGIRVVPLSARAQAIWSRPSPCSPPVCWPGWSWRAPSGSSRRSGPRSRGTARPGAGAPLSAPAARPVGRRAWLTEDLRD
jgi:integrase